MLKKFIENPYNRDNFLGFLTASFGNDIKTFRENQISYDKDGINKYDSISEIELESGVNLGVYAFEVESTKAKVSLNNVLSKILKNTADYSAILATFYTKDKDDFRLSFVNGTWDFQKNKFVLSNPRRQSFEVGKNAKTKAILNQLSAISPKNKTINVLQESFSKEPLSKEFYKAITNYFVDCVGQIALPNNQSDDIKREFALRLIARILFCKFLEKKGIIDSAIWDTTLSPNYYHEVLEPLFFTTLNRQREQRDYANLDCKIKDLLQRIPYLNGGLFEPQENDFYKNGNAKKVPNDTIKSLFEILDNYHFSIDESSGNEQILGLDPEMLGTIFESLLSKIFTDNKEADITNLRKKTGSFYTPREIVDYMSKSAVLEYLKTKCDNITEATLKSLVFGENSPHTQSLAELEKGSINRPQVLSQSPFSTQPPNLTHDARILESNISHSHTANAGSLDSNENLESSLRESEAIYKNADSTDSKYLDSNVDCHDSTFAESRNDKIAESNFERSENKNNLHEVQQPQEASSEERVRVVREGEENDFAFVRSTNPHLQIQVSSPSLKIESIENPCEKDSSNKVESNDLTAPPHSTQSQLTQAQKSHITNALLDLKILDPACGSGAFPMGVLNLLCDILEYLDPDNEAIKARVSEESISDLSTKSSAYTRKLYILQNCIYGSDIQPMATEISRLRSFLSLIIDEEVDCNNDITSLPNLEFKFVCANSLLPLPKSDGLNYDGYQSDIEQLNHLRNANFTSHEKDSIKAQYLALKDKIATESYATIKEQDNNPLINYDPYDTHTPADFFDPAFMFGFDKFDIIIGNPPYIRHEKIKEQKPQLQKYFSIYTSTADLYTYFFEMGFNVLQTNGILSYITSNQWIKSEYGNNLRKFLHKNTSIISHIECGKVFKQANVETSITSFAKCKANKDYKIYFYADLSKTYTCEYAEIPYSQLSDSTSWIFDSSENIKIINKIKSLDFGFYDIVEKIAKGSSSGNDDLYVLDFIQKQGDLCEMKSKIGNFFVESDILVPFIYGENIQRYKYAIATKYILYPYDKITNKIISLDKLMTKYPKAFGYFQTIKDELMKRKIKMNDEDFYKFSALRNAECYINHKIMIPDMLTYPRFGFDNIGLWHNAGIHSLKFKNTFLHLEKMVFAILNSKLFWFFIKYTSTALSKGTYRLMPLYLAPFRFPKIDSNNNKLASEIIALVDKILESKNQDSSFDTSNLESQIDNLVYKLYNLSDDEIKIIENRR